VKLALCRSLLIDDATTDVIAVPKETVEGHSGANVCPLCGKGLMVIVDAFEPSTYARVVGFSPTLAQTGFDTS
jgi:hypothetical protein